MKSKVLELNESDMMVILFLLFCKRETIFESFFWMVVTQNQAFHRVFPLDVPPIPLVIARTALYSIASNL